MMRLKWILFFLLMLLLHSGCDKEIPLDPIALPYQDITVIDIHNHDASAYKYKESMDVWDKYGIDKIVLFGDISEPSAMTTDEIAFDAYRHNPDRIIPFIAGINIHESSCLDYISERFDAGVFGIGEVVAASTYSPVTADLPWKGDHPMDEYFPQIYELCAAYGKPILLHIDPPSGFPLEKLREAAFTYPNTNFIFGHANAFSSIGDLEGLLRDYSNIYIDFFAGFTAYDPESNYTLADYVPLINAYPNRFMVSTDGGFGIGYDKAYTAIYELFDLLEEDVVVKIAGENFLRLINN
jgi:predicted TIM-barrel fold metal-dependent hydrolase